uniref:Uncharacterized protein n=1 Tax=Anguilla anguilla TaxID=7936 RepID=A0A0E9V3F6_ANGAN
MKVYGTAGGGLWKRDAEHCGAAEQDYKLFVKHYIINKTVKSQ